MQIPDHRRVIGIYKNIILEKINNTIYNPYKNLVPFLFNFDIGNSIIKYANLKIVNHPKLVSLYHTVLNHVKFIQRDTQMSNLPLQKLVFLS
jgi:hypothetical protein